MLLHLSNVPQNLYNLLPSLSIGVSQHFTVEFSRSAVSPFFFIRTLQPTFGGPKDKQNSNRFSTASPHVIFPLQIEFLPFSHTETASPKCTYSFNRRRWWSLLLNTLVLSFQNSAIFRRKHSPAKQHFVKMC